MTTNKLELTDYELKDGAYGLYLQQVDECMDNVDIGSHYYPKEQVDEFVKFMETSLNKVNKHLKKLRLKYKTLRQLRGDSLGKCKELLDILEVDK